MPVLDPKALLDNRVEALRGYHNDTGIQKAEIDVSGGVDSAVLVLLLAQALGPENIIAVHSGINTNPVQTDRALEVCEVAGVKLINVDLTKVYETLVDNMLSAIEAAHPEDRLLRVKLHEAAVDDPTILGSLRSCLRAPVGRGFNRIMGGGIRHGTGNECEDRWTRFFQKGGDGEVDTNPIAMLSKGETYQLARALGVPASTIAAAPSPDLWGTGDAHSDEDEYANYFGFKAADFGHTFYSYIDMETGKYMNVGLIERVSRLLDECGEGLFGRLGLTSIDFLGGVHSNAFKSSGLSSTQIKTLLRAARRIEAMTRHKVNKDIPMLGSRLLLVTNGILTNDLPEV